MLRKFKVTYKSPLGSGSTEIEAYSKYNAKKIFYVQFPTYEILKIVEVKDEF
jgi:hypothetical protein